MVLLSSLLLSDLHTQVEVSIDEQDDLIYRDYGTQQYLTEFIPTKTGSGSIFGTVYEIQAREKEIEAQIIRLEETISKEPITVGLIFHILSTDDVRSAMSSVSDQLKALNRDFDALTLQKSHPNDPKGIYARRAANPNIRFIPAETKETEKFRFGISTVRNAGSDWKAFDEMKEERFRGAAPIQPDKYINIWVVDLQNNLSSYSTSPYQPSAFSGIVIDQRLFGTNTTDKNGFIEGKTLTHLMGNYFGLKDLWSPYGDCVDDGVADTPVHNAPVRGCPKYRHITTCDDKEPTPVMSMNFMSTTDDACQYMFTAGQVRRMRAIIQAVRPELIDSKSSTN